MINYTTNNVLIDENGYDEVSLHISYLKALGSILKTCNEELEAYAVNLIGNTQKSLAECALYKIFPKYSSEIEQEEELTLEDIIDRELEVLLDFADILNHLGGHKPKEIVNEIGDVLAILAETAHMRLKAAIRHQRQQKGLKVV